MNINMKLMRGDSQDWRYTDHERAAYERLSYYFGEAAGKYTTFLEGFVAVDRDTGVTPVNP